jgi:hypothetical protein
MRILVLYIKVQEVSAILFSPMLSYRILPFDQRFAQTDEQFFAVLDQTNIDHACHLQRPIFCHQSN